MKKTFLTAIAIAIVLISASGAHAGYLEADLQSIQSDLDRVTNRQSDLESYLRSELSDLESKLSNIGGSGDLEMRLSRIESKLSEIELLLEEQKKAVDPK